LGGGDAFDASYLGRDGGVGERLGHVSADESVDINTAVRLVLAIS
jgi:hypothetical protein